MTPSEEDPKKKKLLKEMRSSVDRAYGLLVGIKSSPKRLRSETDREIGLMGLSTNQ